jgi:hypothetical protein
MLRLADLRRLPGSCAARLNIDFSSISIDLLPALEEALLRECVYNIPAIRLSADLYAQHELQFTNRDRQLPPDLEGSIYAQCPTFRSEFAALLSRILTRARKVRKLTIDSIPLSAVDIDVVAQGLSVCNCIRELRFSHVPLFDQGFQRISQTLKKRGVRILQCRHCRLTDAVAPSVISLISYHAVIQKEAEKLARQQRKQIGLVCLHDLDFRSNRFTPKFVRKMTDAIRHSSVSSFDLRGCPKVPGTLKTLRIFQIGPLPQVKVSMREQLEHENRRLTQRVDTLIGNRQVAVVDHNLFLVGNRAAELADQLSGLDGLIRKLEREVELDRFGGKSFPK